MGFAPSFGNGDGQPDEMKNRVGTPVATTKTTANETPTTTKGYNMRRVTYLNLNDFSEFEIFVMPNVKIPTRRGYKITHIEVA